MAKIFIIALLFILSIGEVSAQKMILVIENIEYNNPRFSNAAKFIKHSLEKNFLKHYGIAIVDRDQTQFILKERELQKNESFMDGVTVKQDKALGAQYLLKLHYNDLSNELNFKFINIESGTLKFVKNYNLNDFVNKINFRISREDYFDRFIKEQVQKIISELDLEEEINVVRMEKIKKTDFVLLHCPDGCNLKIKDELVVFYITDYEYKIKAEIGKIRVTDIENPKLFKAIITKGHTNIENQINNKLKCYVEN